MFMIAGKTFRRARAYRMAADYKALPRGSAIWRAFYDRGRPPVGG